MITRHETRMQVCCDSCPASYPNSYEAEEFAVMISDARTAGWLIRKAPAPRDEGTAELFGTEPRVAGREKPQAFTHTCPQCAGKPREGGLF